MSSPTPSPQNLLAGPKLIGGRYRLESSAGRGGMASVYRARDESTGEYVALKLLDESSERIIQLKFRHEYHILKTLSHPRIVKVFDFGIHESRMFYTMEFLEGRDLRELKNVPVSRACHILRQIASALALIHARGWVHRDISSRNAFVLSDGSTKLIDFGALSSAGVAPGTVIGTPAFLAPEVLRGKVVDRRVDLFGLGAVAYQLLTGTLAFPANGFHELPERWAVRPDPPSRRNPDVPPALDELVLSLLAIEPFGRPSSAAEVIDRLGAIGELDRLPSSELVHGYLATHELLGRDEEMSHLLARMHQMMQSKGATVVVEAESGAGKTRLLREVEVEAKLAGARVLWCEMPAGMNIAHGLLRSLFTQSLTVVPNVARAALSPHADFIVRAMPELAAALGRAAPASSAGDPNQDRARMHAAFVECVLALARALHVVVLIDDLQRADAASLAALAAAAQHFSKRSILLVAAVRVGEEPRAASWLDLLTRQAERIRLGGLARGPIRDLLRSMFGDSSGTDRLSQIVHEAARGNPMVTTEIVRDLVERRVIRLVDGLWVIPRDLGHMLAPRSLEEAAEASIQALDPAARSLAEVLAVYGGPVDLDLGEKIADREDATTLFHGLGALVRAGIVTADGTRHRLRHDGYREALLRGMSEQRKREIHLRLGQALRRDAEASVDRECQIGWHLLRGGNELEGAEFLERAGRKYVDALSPVEAIAPLETALQIYEREGRSPKVCLELRCLLLRLGHSCRRELSVKYADDTLTKLRRYAGVDLFERLQEKIRGPIPLVLALFVRFVQHLFTAKKDRGPNPIVALRNYFIGVGVTLAVASLSNDPEWCERLGRLMRPFRGHPGIFGRVALLAEILGAVPLGRWETMRRRGEELLEIYGRDKNPPVEKRLAVVGIKMLLAYMDARDGNPACLSVIEEIASSNLPGWDLGAQQILAVYHMRRGEVDAAELITRALESRYLESGCPWQMEAWLPAAHADAYCFLQDVMGLKRVIEELDRAVQKGIKFEAALEVARATYHMVRGELELARAAHRRAVEHLPKEEGIVRSMCLHTEAEIELAAGNAVAAKALALRTLDFHQSPEQRKGATYLCALRCLALAEASLGHFDRAREHIQHAITEATRSGNPAFLAIMHDGAARIAVLAGDEAAFKGHVEVMNSAVWPTHNGALIARCERLFHLGSAAFGRRKTSSPKNRAAKPVTLEESLRASSDVAARLAMIIDPLARALAGLDALLADTGARTGALFLLEDGRLVEVARRGVEDVSAQASALERALMGARDGARPTFPMFEARGIGDQKKTLVFEPLFIRGREDLVVVGAAVLIQETDELHFASPTVVCAVAQALAPSGGAEAHPLFTQRTRTASIEIDLDLTPTLRGPDSEDMTSSRPATLQGVSHAGPPHVSTADRPLALGARGFVRRHRARARGLRSRD